MVWMLSFVEAAFKIVLVTSCLVGSLTDGLKADTRDSLQQQKQDIETRIQQEQDLVREFTQAEAQLMENLDSIDFQLNQAQIRMNAIHQQIKELERNMTVIRSDRQVLAQRIDDRQSYAEKRLTALYRMHAAGRMNMMALPDTLFDFLVNRRALAQVVTADYDLLDRLARDMTRMQVLESRLKEQASAVKKLEQDLAEDVQIKTAASRKKQEILQAVRQQKKVSHAALAALEKSARDLDQQIMALEKQTQSTQDPGAFFRQKGRLILPVPGKIISRFGIKQSGDYKSFTFQSGIDIRGEQGEPVRTVFRGDVIFAEWLKGYGNVVIIDHGDHYYTLYAHLQEMFRKKGDAVDTGDVIATLGDTGSLKGVRLHFELRHHGKPVNPVKWLKKGA
jgi:septal ring factor EnvC (AmiA/AmiB activator)